MVATRRGTCVEPQKEGDRSGKGQATEEVISPPSPRQTRSCSKKDGQTSEHSADEGKSAANSRSPLKYDALKLSPQITTRSRHRSEQSDANVSEAESCASNTSTRRSRSRQSLGQVIDSTRKLRSHGSSLITEPISESKEDAEISEAESNFSSVSSTARKVKTRTSSRPVSTRSRKSVLPSERPSDVSDAETNSSVSGVKTIATRSTRNSRARHQPSLVSESQKEQTSDAESCSSELSRKPSARRSSRRNKSNLQSDEMESANETDKNDSQTVKKQSPKVHDVKSDAPSSGQEQNVLSSPLRSLRHQPAIQKDEVILISDEEPEIVDKDLNAEQEEVEETSVETRAAASLQSSKTQHEENIIPDQILELSDNSMDAEPTVEESHITKDSDAAEETNENLQNVQESSDIAEHTNICLFIDSDGSEKSEHGGDDDHIENEIMEVEEDNEVVQKEKSNKASTQQLQDVVEDGLFVIDKAPGVDSSKNFFLDAESESDNDDEDSAADVDDEDADSDDADSAADGDEDENDANNGDFVANRKAKRKSKQHLQDVAGDGLFVIDTTPGVDSSKKYFLEPETVHDKEEADERGEVAEPEVEGEDDDDFIDKDEDDDEDEEEALLNRPKKGLELSTSIDTGINLKKMGGLYISFDAEKQKPGPSLLSKMKKGIKNQDELLRKSVITPDFEKKESVPPFKESRYKLKKLRKMEREKTTGRGWFDMKAPELTDELKGDLKALKMRSAMDPKHFYKKNDREGFPKYFEVGTVVDSPVDFYHSRIPKKQRKRTIVEELLADSEFRRYNKKKYKEIIEEKTARAAGKKNRKKKKFRT